MEIKLICSDIDGTLINKDKEITPYTREMIQRSYHEKGIPFALVSGRFLGGLLPLEEQLGIPCIRACYNGAYIEYEGKVIKNEPTAKEVLLEAYEMTKGFDVTPVLFNNEHFFMEQYGPKYKIQEYWSGKCGIVAPFKTVISEHGPYKMVTRSDDPDEILRFEEAVKRANIPGLDVFRSSPIILEFVKKGIDKANVVHTLAKHLNIGKDNVMAFGDFNNDMNMLQAAGYGIAMGNALDEVKKIAFATTASCEEDGIGKAISKYIFNEA